MSGFRRDHRDHNRSTSAGHATPATRRPSTKARAALRTAFALASILTVGQGCDKARELAGGGGAEAAEPSAAQRLDLSSRPEILFQVFGESNDARMMPIAVIQGGQLDQIVLASAGWKQFDAMYGKSGTSYTLYSDGRAAGTATVRQGMWEKPQEPLYSLPSCELMVPLSRVRLDARRKMGFTVEAFASNATLGRAAGSPGMSADDVADAARQVGESAAQRARISSGTLEGLNLSADAIEIRAGGAPVIVAAFTDPKADDKAASGGKTASIFAIAEPAEDGSWQIAYSHIVNGAADDAEYRRYIDHLDIDRDGTDEIVLEGWDASGASFLSFLRADGTKWTEVFRSRAQWCLDKG